MIHLSQKYFGLITGDGQAHIGWMRQRADGETRLGELTFERGFPTEETKRKVFDEIDYQRAVQAYLWAYPAVSLESIRIGVKRDLSDKVMNTLPPAGMKFWELRLA